MNKVNKLIKEYAVLSPEGQTDLWNSDDFWKMAFNPDHPKNKAEMGYLVSDAELVIKQSIEMYHQKKSELIR